MDAEAQPVVPRYGAGCLNGVIPAVLGQATNEWLPEAAAKADQVVVLVLDGLGWDQLKARPEIAPTLSSMKGGSITTVIPSTTATALTSLTTGATPAEHGVVGYRLRVGGTNVLNVLRWKTADGDQRTAIPPTEFQTLEPFAGKRPAVVTRGEFADSGFTGAHLAGVRFYGWRMPSTLVARVGMLLADGEPFVYAYYEGVDKVAHEFGLGALYDAEVAAADRLVADVIDLLPSGAALLVVADHGQVDVGDNVVTVHDEVMRVTAMLSGEGRFRWLHARAGCRDRLIAAARRCHGDDAWVRTREEAVAEGWFGGILRAEFESRLGDVVLAARKPVAFLDPADTGKVKLKSRHGSLTPAEMLVPLLCATP